MLTIRILAAGAAFIAGMMLSYTTAHACDERYPGTCAVTPAPAAEPTAAPGKPMNLRAVSARSKTKAKHRPRVAKRSRHVRSRTAARKGHSRARLAHRSRSAAKVAEARKEKETEPVPMPQPAPIARNSTGTVDAEAASTAPAAAPAAAPSAAPTAAAQAEPPAAAPNVEAEQAQAFAPSPLTLPQSQAAPTKPIRVASQDEINEIDLAAPPASVSSTTDAPDETSWIRRMLIAIGGVLTLGSAVRLLVG